MRYALLECGEYSYKWTAVMIIPDGLSREVLEVWLSGTDEHGRTSGDAWLMCIIRGGELEPPDKPSPPEPYWFSDEFRETAMAMIGAAQPEEKP